MNRTVAPGLLEPEKIHLMEPEILSIQNAPIYIFNLGTQDVAKVEIIFNAGSRFHSLPLIASLTNELIDEGTSTKTSAQIAELFDYYGAHIQTECNVDYASVTLFTLTKFLNKTVALLIEIINESIYPEDEVQTYIQQEKQRLTINQGKVDYLVRKHFNAELFKGHRYGYFPKIADYDAIKRADILAFSKANYHSGLHSIIVSGQISDVSKKDLLKVFEQLKAKKTSTPYEINHPKPTPPVHKFIEKEDAVQNAIRIGKRLFNRTHPDYPKLTVLNTILGGYFGSRLMSNIREDKGYTYGIGSGLVSLSEDGYFYIATEVGAPVFEDAIKEIFKEISKLNEELVPTAELTLVRNYLLGSFQRSIDGPFAISDRFKTILLSGLSYDYFYNYLDIVKNITPQELLTLSQKHLFPSDLTQVCVGKKLL